ncbi:MAG: NAD(P)-dependent glycerol-3-phosphate dehydrogenase [Deltaproteobacteria bacterium]|nr:NAD(P)-dependent glycerol-3-phosphate dehydrogenase [Deltaproteobacteria bacterium]
MTGRVTVLGAGSWGTTIAELLAGKGYSVHLWARSPEVSSSILERRENSVYLPGVRLSKKIMPSTGLEAALDDSSLVISAIPSHGVRKVFTEAAQFMPEGAIVVSATKGIEEGTLLSPSGIIKDALRGVSYKGIVILSGPSFAKEVSRKLPAAVTAASSSDEAAKAAQKAFSTDYFRVYTNNDVVGVELGGALKNVIAVASGISDGLKLGFNARAALITRGLAEITRLGAAMGAKPSTFSGLSGLGDLVLTCTGPLSRNYSLGVSMGQGRTLADITSSMRMVAEGVKTSSAARSLALLHKTDMPITEAVFNVLHEGKQPKDAVYNLMNRGLKGE